MTAITIPVTDDRASIVAYLRKVSGSHLTTGRADLSETVWRIAGEVERKEDRKAPAPMDGGDGDGD